MPLDWNEIANRARVFSNDWKHVEREEADAKSFWDEFFAVFGIKRRKVATFEKRIKKIDNKDGYIDLLWKGTLLIEHKSRGKDRRPTALPVLLPLPAATARNSRT